jgi:sarcosine/dimethylglycine N-methyltransferase
MTAEDTGRFAPYVDLYLEMVDKQLSTTRCASSTSIRTRSARLCRDAVLRQLAHAGKIAQGRLIARKR